MEESLYHRRRFLARLESLGCYTFVGDEDVLDVGCGLGGSTIALAERARRVIGIEAGYSPQHGGRGLSTYGLTNAAIYHYGLVSRHLSAPAFPVGLEVFDVVFSYRGMGRFDLWDGAAIIRPLLKPGGRVIVLYPHFWYPLAPLDTIEARLWHYGLQNNVKWDRYTFDALQERWQSAGLYLEGLIDAQFPPVHAASYVLDLSGFSHSRTTVSRRLRLTSATMIPTALLCTRAIITSRI
ncbi:MAG: class I SAM-dependent methyltransferase [Anaerolineae bacterium]